MIQTDAPPGGQLADVAGQRGVLGEQERQRRLDEIAPAHPLQRDRHAALKEDGQLLFKRGGKALFGGDAYLPGTERGLHRLVEDILALRLPHMHRRALLAEGVCALHLVAAVGQPAADEVQLGDLLVDAGQLAAQKHQTAVDGVVLHVLLNFFQREAYLLHDEDGVQKIQLGGAVIAVAVVRVHPGRAEQADLVVKIRVCLEMFWYFASSPIEKRFSIQPP